MSNDDAKLGATLRQALQTSIRPTPLPAIQSPVDSLRGQKARLAALERWFGGPAGAAAAVGVTLRTYRRWGAGGKLARASQGKVRDAYNDEWRRRSNTPARRRITWRRAVDGDQHILAGEFARVSLKVWAEFQVDGYYNGQTTNSPKRQPYAPNAENAHAFRGIQLGTVDLRPVVSAFAGGDADGGQALEALLPASMLGAQPIVFANSYHHTPQFEVTS